MQPISQPETAARRPAIGLLILCQAMEELELDCEAALGQAGLRRRELEQPGSAITRAQEDAFLQAVLDSRPRPDLAMLVGRRYHFGVYGLWGLAIVSARHLLQAFEVSNEFSELTHSFARLALFTEGDSAGIQILHDYPPGPVRDFVLERDVVATLVISTEAAGQQLPLRRIEMPYPRPAHASALEQLFGCPVVYNSDGARALIDASVLDQPLPASNPVTHSACVHQCQLLAQQISGQSSLQRQLRYWLPKLGFPPAPVIAGRLGVSERSLRRRLKSEGLSYRLLVQELRQEMAMNLLADHSLSLEAIAHTLGFSEAANFSHAFRQWTGTTPGAARRSAQEFKPDRRR